MQLALRKLNTPQPPNAQLNLQISAELGSVILGLDNLKEGGEGLEWGTRMRVRMGVI